MQPPSQSSLLPVPTERKREGGGGVGKNRGNEVGVTAAISVKKIVLAKLAYRFFWLCSCYRIR